MMLTARKLKLKNALEKNTGRRTVVLSQGQRQRTLRREKSQASTPGSGIGWLRRSSSLKTFCLPPTSFPHQPQGQRRNLLVPALVRRRRQQQQIRNYIFLPASLSEFQQRFQRWVEEAEKRVVDVKLLNRNSTNDSTNDNKLASGASRSRSSTSGITALTDTREVTSSSETQSESSDLFAKRRRWVADALQNDRARFNAWVQKYSLPLPLISTTQSDVGWKLRGQEQYQAWRRRGQEKYEGWKARRQQDWIKTKRVLLEEYSKPEWFDDLGRPLTSRDSTGRFVNPWQSQSTNGEHSLEIVLKWRLERAFRSFGRLGTVGSLMPVLSWFNSQARLQLPAPPAPLPTPSDDELQLTWLGHSSCWIQMNGMTILTDPMFSLRASPYQWLPVGVPREYAHARSIEELVEHSRRIQINRNPSGGDESDILSSPQPPIDICCITHDHYDHLDRDSVEQLKPFVKLWVVPLGLAEFLVKSCDVNRDCIIELEWWQQVHLNKEEADNYGGYSLQATMSDASDGEGKDSTVKNTETLTITCCPSSHWASRTMMDRNTRLWCSFALTTERHRLFVCGDTGYPTSFPLFRQIGDALGPFDLSAIPIGAYEPSEMMRDSHVNPKEAVQIHKDLRSLQSIAIHWGTFMLSEESLCDPPKELKRAMDQEKQPVPAFEALSLGGTVKVRSTETIPSYFGSDDDDDDDDDNETCDRQTATTT